jgi:type II secretory pathway component PulK
MAILMVLICLAILLPFTASFNYQARVDWQSAVNHGDEVRARNINRGAIQLSELLFILQRQVFNQKQFIQYVGRIDITQVAPYLMSVFGTEDGAEGLGALVGMDTAALSDLSLKGGSFEMRLEAESGKTNVNCLALAEDGKDNPQARVVEALEQTMSPTLYDPLFEEERSDGERYTRQQVLMGIVDYIDDDRKRFDLARLKSSSVGENYRYTELHDPYQARNARLDSLEELYLVQGVDDDWMAAFADNLTVYGGDCKVNLNFASAEQIALVLRHSVSGADKYKTEGENYLLMTLPLANFVVETREFNTLFKELKDFKDLVARPDEYISPLALMAGEGEQQSNLPRVPDGMEVRVKGGENKATGDEWGGLRDVATIAPERVYSVEIITEVGGVKKRARGVYDMQYARSQSSGKGAWLYYRED